MSSFGQDVTLPDGRSIDEVFVVYRQWNFHGVNDMAEVHAQELVFEECYARSLVEKRNEGTLGSPWRYSVLGFRLASPYDAHVHRHQRYVHAKPHERRKMREGRA